MDCPVCVECTVVGSIRTGLHEMFSGKIECVHADAQAVMESREIDFGKIDLL